MPWWLLVFMAPTACLAIYKNSKSLDILPTQKHIVALVLSVWKSLFFLIPWLISTHHPRFSSGDIISTKTPWICLHLATCAPTDLYVEIAVVLVLLKTSWWQEPSLTWQSACWAGGGQWNPAYLNCLLTCKYAGHSFRKKAMAPMSFSSHPILSALYLILRGRWDFKN